jgi:hypothetical protein
MDGHNQALPKPRAKSHLNVTRRNSTARPAGLASSHHENQHFDTERRAPAVCDRCLIDHRIPAANSPAQPLSCGALSLRLPEGTSNFLKPATHQNNMKPTTTSKIEYRLVRHDRRAQSRRALLTTDYFFRQQPDAPLGRARSRPGERARRAFRQMTAEMLTKYERDEPMELFLFAFVTALAAWPLVDLLIVLAQTANG